jgi:hypothetical protein
MLQNNRLSKNNKGMSLVEVIALIAVLSVVVAAVVGFMITGSKMSVNVSGKAGASIKEQTAVEFINKTILKYGVDALELYSAEGEDTKALKIMLSNGKSAFICTQEGAVVYKIGESDKVTELCPGTIDFELNTDTETVIYKLNDDEEHVLRLRVAPKSQ